MATLTHQQRAWFNSIKNYSANDPFDTSDLISFTIGDGDITVFKNSSEVNEHHTKKETGLG